MKYRLLKTLDGYPPGSIFYYTDYGDHVQFSKPATPNLPSCIVPAELAQDPNWFEEVKPWVPKDGDMYYYVADHLEACGEPFCESKTSVPTVDMQRANAGNCFRTEQEANDCAAQMRVLLAAWKEAHS